MLRVVDARSGNDVAREESGAFAVWDQREYIVQGESLHDVPPVLKRQPLGGTAMLCFDNYVGQAIVLGHRFQVRHSKLTEAEFDTLLDGVVADFADLAFRFDTPTAQPFERDVLAATQIAYHAVAYLRHVMLRADQGEGLLGQFMQIARVPHRHTVREHAWADVHRVSEIGTRGALAIATHSERLVALPRDSNLRSTALAQRLGGRFPASVLSERRSESFDTHENRLVKAVLLDALELVRKFDARTLVNPSLRDDLRAMRGELEWMAAFDFLSKVEAMTVVPFQSSVMQRREGYREFLTHYIQLGLGSRLAQTRELWERLLDLKDGALLYELWAFLEVKRVLDGMLGEPRDGEFTSIDETQRTLPWPVRLFYDNGVELTYNESFGSASGSYSVTLRPDIVVRDPSRRLLILDAKLKFDGMRLDESNGQEPEDWMRRPGRADLYKMHTYRDALAGVVGAYVLYPGSEYQLYTAHDGDFGVGAVPLVPGKPALALVELLERFLCSSASQDRAGANAYA